MSIDVCQNIYESFFIPVPPVPPPPSPSQPSPYTRARDLPRVTPEPFVKSAASIEINALCRFIFIDFNCAFEFRYFGYL